MFPLKRFVQGPSLQDEIVSYEDEPESRPLTNGPLSGEQVSQVYQEIINLPSTASTGESTTSQLQSQSSSSSKSVTLKDEDSDSEPPKFSKLMSLSETNDHTSLEDILKEHPHLVDATDEFGWTLLMSASCAGALNCVSILLQNGADWDTEDKKGLTAFTIAKKNRQEAVSDLLQQWDACYNDMVERLQREEATGGSATSGNDIDNSSPSRRYCEVCHFVFESSVEEHEKSIAHLVSTAQFGKDRIHFGIPESNKGFQLMVKSGWDKESGLGPDGRGHKFPVKTVLKRNKLGLGNEVERKAARITHFGPFDAAAVEAPQRTEREVTVQRREAAKSRNKEKRKEINFRREFASL